MPQSQTQMSPGMKALNRLAKWRTIFTGWQLGTRAKGDPESDAVSHHRELSILLRAEVNAITQLLVKRGVFTGEDFDAQLVEEVEHLERIYEEKFPGAKASDDGMVLQKDEVYPWMSKFPK